MVLQGVSAPLAEPGHTSKSCYGIGLEVRG